MVRRRTRATKVVVTDATDRSHHGHTVGLLCGTSAASSLLDDQYFASPKRKDCKIENTNTDLEKKNCDQSKCALDKPVLDDKPAKTERGGINGRTIGVPLATRSQTKTIENFFKASAAARSKNQSGTVRISPVPNHPPHALTNGKQSPLQTECISPNRADMLFDLSEDDDTCTELSDECHPTASHHHNQSAHIEDSDSDVTFMGAPYYRPSRSSTDNIFLQEPVLSLNVDISPNQATWIKINKSLEIEPIFSSPPSAVAKGCTSTLNGRFNTIVSLNGSPTKRDFLEMTKKSNCYLLSMDNDNSSCDSGVAFTPLDNNNSASNQGRRRKPATPHRIVCPSPIKSGPTSGLIVSPGATATAIYSLSGKTSTQSPRKRHPTKSRRRLHDQQKQLQKATSKSYHKAPHDNIRYRLEIDGDDDDDDLNDEDDHQHNHEFENQEGGSSATAAVATTNHPKSILNSAKNPTAEQNTNNNNNISKTKGKNHNHITRKPSSSKLKHQQPQSVAAANGNRELDEFFPVRRSVRKTKTAVNEEMMRNFERAIIEECEDGLKVADFEGKGRGIIADRRFQRNDFVVEYVGDLIDMVAAGERERRYALDENAGCYMYYFKHKNKQYCIDATVDTGKLGRLVNHSRTGNLVTKVVVVKSRPHLILIAKDDIAPGEELTYDYGDRSKEALLHHPWLAF